MSTPTLGTHFIRWAAVIPSHRQTTPRIARYNERVTAASLRILRPKTPVTSCLPQKSGTAYASQNIVPSRANRGILWRWPWSQLRQACQGIQHSSQAPTPCATLITPELVYTKKAVISRGTPNSAIGVGLRGFAGAVREGIIFQPDQSLLRAILRRLPRRRRPNSCAVYCVRSRP